MNPKKIKTGFSGLSEPDIIKQGADVKIGMPENKFFPTLTDQITAFVTAYDAFIAAIPARQLRNTVTIAERDARRETLNQKMYLLAYGVMSIAYGNDEAIESSGFKTTETPSSKPIPSKPTNVEIFIAPQPNTLVVTCNANSDASMYEVKVSEDKDTWPWTNTETSRKVTVTGITPGVIVFVKMRLKNSTGDGSWSDSIAARIPLPTEPTVKYMNSK